MNVKILHIPTGEIFSTSGLLSKTRQEAEKEFKIAMEFIVAPISDHESGLELYRLLRWELTRIGIEVPIENPIYWIDDFIDFLVTLGYYPIDITGYVKWESILEAEFELL